MGPRWIFFTDGHLLRISSELVFISDNISYAWFAMAGREREREEITSSRKTSSKVSSFFLDFVTFSLWNVFLTKIIFPEEKSPCRKVNPKNAFSEDTLIYVLKKNGYLKDKSYKNAFPLLFHCIRFNGSWKWQNINWEKYCQGKVMKFFTKFPHFYQSKSFSRLSFFQ